MADIFNMTDTWNNGATVFTSVKMNVTDTASNAASKLVDLQVGGTSKVSVRKDGRIIGDGASPYLELSQANGSTLSYGNNYFFAGGSTNIGTGNNGLSIVGNSGTAIINTDAANTLAQRNGTSAQAFNLYNTYTDASNYERGFIRYASNVLEIGHEGAGTGNNSRTVAIRTAGFNAVTFDAANATFNVSILGSGSIRVNGGAGTIGYATGAGGAVTQITSRTTGVTLDKASGAITLVSAAGSTTIAAFTVTNARVAATDTIIVSQKSGTDKYRIYVTAVAAGSFEISYATLAGTTTEQPVFNFAVIKAVAS